MLLNYEKETSYWLAPRLAARFSAILHPNSTNGERRASLLVRLFISNHGNRLQLLRWFRLVLELRDEVRKYQLYDIPGGLPMIGGFLTLSFKYWLRESGGELNGLVGWTGSRMWELLGPRLPLSFFSFTAGTHASYLLSRSNRGRCADRRGASDR
jgi:hypothetical protein